ncbi:MAG: hypothetical protein HC809_15110, partial [Gammaproteobacteria bacterium]|nr:hypothetical protein [Gammaproteobacteria bacterium]
MQRDIREALFKKGAEDRPPLKEVRVNRCPFVAPLKVLHKRDEARLGIDLGAAEVRRDALMRDSRLRDRVRSVYTGRADVGEHDV